MRSVTVGKILFISEHKLSRMTNLNKLLAIENYDAKQLGLDQNRRAALLVSDKVDTPSEKGLHRQMVNNNTARNQLEELLLKVKATTEDIEVANNTKFVNAKKLKLQHFLRAALRTNYEQKMFLKLALENWYEAAEAFKSVDMDDKAMDGEQVGPGEGMFQPCSQQERRNRKVKIGILSKTLKKILLGNVFDGRFCFLFEIVAELAL